MRMKVQKLAAACILSVLIATSSYAQTDRSEFGKEHEARIVSLLQKLESKDQLEQIDASIALQKEANNGDLKILVDTLRKGNVEPKQIAIIHALATIGDRRAAEVLRFEIENGKGQPVLEAITALGKLGTNWAIPILVNQLASSKSIVKAEDEKKTIRALVAIAKIKTPRALDTLKAIGADLHPSFHNLLTWLIKYREKKLSYTKLEDEIPRARGIRFAYQGVGASFYYPSEYADAPSRPWLLVCIPDNKFDVEELFQKCQEEARKQKMAVLVPHLHPYFFLESQSFNIGDRRSDTFLLSLLDFLQKHAEIESNEIYLYGAGTAGSFVERFVMAYPRRVARAVVVNSEIVIPNSDVLFPHGARKTPFALDIEVNLYDYVKSDLVLLLGDDVNKKRLEGFEAAISELQFGRGVLPRVTIVHSSSRSFNDAMLVMFRPTVSKEILERK